MADQNIEITAYLKTFCGWSEGVRSIFRKYDLEWEEKDIIQNPAFRWEMEQKSGQPLSPCVIRTVLHKPAEIAARLQVSRATVARIKQKLRLGQHKDNQTSLIN